VEPDIEGLLIEIAPAVALRNGANICVVESWVLVSIPPRWVSWKRKEGEPSLGNISRQKSVKQIPQYGGSLSHFNLGFRCKLIDPMTAWRSIHWFLLLLPLK
jgi:hypothetical protein